jgi:hypothetical protein
MIRVGLSHPALEIMTATPDVPGHVYDAWQVQMFIGSQKSEQFLCASAGNGQIISAPVVISSLLSSGKQRRSTCERRQSAHYRRSL